MNDLAKDGSLLNCVVPKLQRAFEKVIAWAGEEKFRFSDLFFLGIYGAVVGFGLLHHEPWSDEALPWIIARDTDWRGFLEIIFHNWDRHPGLFHAALLPLVKLGFPFFAQSILNALLALTSAFVFLSKAPFPRIFRYLFLFSYYMIYEYSVITRPYMLAITLLFILAAFYPKRGRHPLFYAILIAMLFHADYMTFGLAAGMTLAFFLEHKKAFQEKPLKAIAFALMVLNGALIAWMAHALPSGHNEYGSKLPLHFLNGIKPLANAFFPFSDLGRHPAFAFPAAVLAGSAVLIMVFVSLIRKPLPTLVLGVSLGYLFTIFLFFHGGDFRNHGFILLSIIFVLWIGKAPSEDSPEVAEEERAPHKGAARTALIIMSACFLLGFQNLMFVYLLEYHLPFSGARDMAKAIAKIEEEKHISEQGFVIVAPHKNSVGLMPYLPDVRFWNPCTGNFADYYKLTRDTGRCNDLPEMGAIQIAELHFRDLNRVLFLFRNPLPFDQDTEYEYQLVFAIPKAFGHWQETFFLYRVWPRIFLEKKNVPSATMKELAKNNSGMPG